MLAALTLAGIVVAQGAMYDSGSLAFGGGPTMPQYQVQVWDDLTVAALSARTPAAAAPGLDTFPAASNTKTLCFDAGSDEEVYFSAQLPHSYRQGTTIKPHIHWAPTSTHTGTVDWTMDCNTAAINGAFAATSSTAKQAGGGVSEAHQISSFDDIPCTTCGISTILVCRLYRDADDATNDTYTGDACLLAVDFHHLLDQPGSASASAK